MEFDLDSTLTQMRQLDTSGNIIPHSWYKAITFESGKPDLLGMMILAEIVYWYRPVEIRDQYTGLLTGYRKKFKSDMLQRNYASFAEQFGVSSRQAMDAIKRLEQKGFVIKVVRTIQTETITLGNVLFIAPNIEKLLDLQTETTTLNPKVQQNGKDISVASYRKNPYTFERTSSNDQTNKLMQSNEEAPAFESMTYTENTTEITPEIKKTAAEEEFVKKMGDSSKNDSAAAVLKKLEANANPFHRNADSKNVKLPVTGRAQAGVLPNKQVTERKTQQIKFEPIISKTLTKNQQTEIERFIYGFENNPAVQKKLQAEIEFCLLDVESFTQAGQNFAKKLNTIKKYLREGLWTTPEKLEEKEQQKIESHEQEKFKKEQELKSECAHWQYVAKIHQEKNQPKHAELALDQHRKALEILRKFHEVQQIVNYHKETVSCTKP